jgi:Domain of unknown function (DUF4440)
MLKTISFILLLVASLSLEAQQDSVNDTKEGNTETDIAQLRTLNAQFIKNFLFNDTVAHNKIIHKDFICINSNGFAVSRDEYMKQWSHGYDLSFYKSFVMQNEFIRLTGNTALVIAETYYSFMENGKEVFKITIYTDTYIKLDGRWWCIQAQMTPKKMDLRF